MEKTEMEEFSRSLWDSLAEASRKMIEEKAERGEMMVYSNEEGDIYHIEARELLKKMSEKENDEATPSTREG